MSTSPRRTEWEKRYGGGECYLFIRVMDHDGTWSCVGSTTWLSGPAELTCAFASGADIQDVVAGVMEVIERQRGKEMLGYEACWVADLLDTINRDRKLWT
jgi:hypothetical protein